MLKIGNEKLSFMNRRTFLQIAVGATGWLAGRCAGAAEGAKPSSAKTDGEVLASAKERISQCRQSDGVVRVMDAAGKPMAGAEVKLEQVRHDFLFGCNLFRFGHLNSDLEEAYRERFAALLNYATLGFYWPSYEPERGHPIYAYTDQVVEWCQQARIVCKGHPLVWDFADPHWLPHDFTQIAQLSHARVREIVARFRGKIDRWDVVNEPTHLGRFNTRLGEWAMSLGAVPYVTEHLKIARAANPEATLLVNDYRTDPPYYRILDSLRQDGKLLFDTIGIQSHMHGGGWPLARVWEVCDTYAKLGVPIHFTETTIVSGPKSANNQWGPSTPEGEAAQADYVPKFYTTLFAHPAVHALTWWDFSDNGAWQRAAAGWVRRDMSPKPVYERLQALIKGDWWTKTQGQTNADGEFATRAFYGTHRISAQSANGAQASKEIHWERGKPNRFEVSIS